MKKTKIILLGASGTVGQAITRNFRQNERLGKIDLISPSREELDLFDSTSTVSFISQHRPDCVINAAGKVAGIAGNLNNPADMILTNLTISTNVINSCLVADVKKYFQFASACIYPNDLDRPAKEEDIFTGAPERTSLSYAAAKLASLQTVRAINIQHRKNWTTLIPSNLYGVGDWTHGENGHVIAMLVDKFNFASNKQITEVHVWGDGSPKRNFLNVDDLANAVAQFIEMESELKDVINLSAAEEFSIKELAFLISNIFEYDGRIIFDSTKPNGAMKKALDDSYARSIGWSDNLKLTSGLEKYIKAFKANIQNAL